MRKILGHLLKSNYSSIGSVIFFAPNMRLHAPQIDRQFTIWSSSPSNNPSANAVDPAFLHEIGQGWTSFLECKTGETIKQYHYTEARDTHALLDAMKFVIPEN